MILNDLRLSESVPLEHYWFQFPFLQHFIMFYESITSSLASLDRSQTIRTLINVSTREKTTLTTQINSDCHMTWLSLILIDYLEKDRNSNWEQRYSKHNRIGFITGITVYISMFLTLVKTNFYSELLRYNSIFNFQEVYKNLFFGYKFLSTSLSYHKSLFSLLIKLGGKNFHNE